MGKPTIGKVEFGPGREPPRVPMGELRDGTCIGMTRIGVGDGIVVGVDFLVEHLEPWARAALERGLKAMQEDVL